MINYLAMIFSLNQSLKLNGFMQIIWRAINPYSFKMDLIKELTVLEMKVRMV
jgi:hypothetical protein